MIDPHLLGRILVGKVLFKKKGIRSHFMSRNHIRSSNTYRKKLKDNGAHRLVAYFYFPNSRRSK